MERAGAEALDSGAAAEANRDPAHFVATAEDNSGVAHFVEEEEDNKGAVRFAAPPASGRVEECSDATGAADTSSQVSGPANSHAPHQRARFESPSSYRWAGLVAGVFILDRDS